MKRLKSKLLGMETNTQTYEAMYDGAMTIKDPRYPNMPPIPDHCPIYYKDDIGFDITGTHKLAQDKPTVVVIIPSDRILCDIEGGMPMKRLKYFLHQMQNDTATYKEMYDGKMEVNFYSTAWDGRVQPPEVHHISTYWHDDNACEITTTHKLAQDKPTVTWSIPVENIGLKTYTAAAADFCLREFGKYIDALNAELYNRSRPDNENGKYYLHTPGGEILERNTAYFSLCPQRDYNYGSGSTVYLMPDDQLQPPKMCLCIRMQVQLPKKKLRKTIQMLCRDLPDAVDRFLMEFDHVRLNEALALAEKQAAIRAWLKESDYCAFVANGSILPPFQGNRPSTPKRCSFPVHPRG